MIIKITSKLGSRFQEEFASNFITQTLTAIKLYLSNSHKNNRIEIEIDGVQIGKIKRDTNLFKKKIEVKDIDDWYELRERFVSEYGRRISDIVFDDQGEYIITDELEGEMEDGKMTSFGNGKKVYLPDELQTVNKTKL